MNEETSKIGLQIIASEQSPPNLNLENLLNLKEFTEFHEQNQIKLMNAIDKLIQMGYSNSAIIQYAKKISSDNLTKISQEEIINRILDYLLSLNVSTLPNSLPINPIKVQPKERIKSESIESPKDTDFIIPENPNSICTICIQKQAENKKKIIIDKCNHNFCSGCIHEQLKTNIMDRNFDNIRCPFLGCQNILLNVFITKHLNEKELIKQNTLKECRQLENNPNIVFCSCGKWGERRNSEEIKIHCVGCSKPLCFTCKNQWHQNLTCKQYLENQLLLADVDNIKIKQCPNCKSAISKSQGCKHMICKCQYEFCWVCLNKWEWTLDNCILEKEPSIQNRATDQFGHEPVRIIIRSNEPSHNCRVAESIYDKQKIVLIYLILIFLSFLSLGFGVWFLLASARFDENISSFSCNWDTQGWLLTISILHFIYCAYVFFLFAIFQFDTLNRWEGLVATIMAFIFFAQIISFIGICCQYGWHKDCGNISSLLGCNLPLPLMNNFFACLSLYLRKKRVGLEQH